MIIEESRMVCGDFLDTSLLLNLNVEVQKVQTNSFLTSLEAGKKRKQAQSCLEPCRAIPPDSLNQFMTKKLIKRYLNDASQNLSILSSNLRKYSTNKTLSKQDATEMHDMACECLELSYCLLENFNFTKRP